MKNTLYSSPALKVSTDEVLYNSIILEEYQDYSKLDNKKPILNEVKNIRKIDLGSLKESRPEVYSKITQDEKTEKPAEKQTTPELVYSVTKCNAKPVKHFLTDEERKFYYTLKKCIPKDTMILIKPRLIDLVIHKPEEEGHYSVLAMHLDFVIMSVPQMIALTAIELDGTTHNEETKQRDDLKNEVLYKNNISLIRVQLSGSYDTDKLTSLLEEVCT